MKEISSTQKLCSFYVSNMHFATMILPFVNKQIKEKTSVVTFLENNFTTNIYKKQQKYPWNTISS